MALPSHSLPLLRSLSGIVFDDKVRSCASHNIGSGEMTTKFFWNYLPCSNHSDRPLRSPGFQPLSCVVIPSGFLLKSQNCFNYRAETTSLTLSESRWTSGTLGRNCQEKQSRVVFNLWDTNVLWIYNTGKEESHEIENTMHASVGFPKKITPILNLKSPSQALLTTEAVYWWRTDVTNRGPVCLW